MLNFRSHRRRILLLIFLLLILAAVSVCALLIQPSSDTETSSAAPADPSVTLFDYDPSQVRSVTIRRGEEATWTATPDEQHVVISGDIPLLLTHDECTDFLRSAALIIADDVLTDDPSDYAAHLADYGLDNPRYEARILYADGTDVTLHIGNKGPDGMWRYMLVSNDPRLYAFSNGSVEGLFVNRDTLRKVKQPDLHKARIDRITLSEGERRIQWALTSDITAADAIDHWQITSPIVYPADAEAMSQLLTSAANLRLSAWVAPATEENLARFGFDAPRLTIEIHQAAGTIAATTADGEAEAIDYSESTLTYIVGGEKSDMIDYIRCGDDIYLASHFTMGVFMDYDVYATMSRFPVMIALGNLKQLTIREGDVVTEYSLTRTEQVAANNALITDEDGHAVYTTAVTKDGKPVDFAAFESAYQALTTVTVSGTLSASAPLPVPHTAYIFTDVDGTVHTVELATFDVLHDAVIVNGHAAFYLIKDGFRLNLD